MTSTMNVNKQNGGQKQKQHVTFAERSWKGYSSKAWDTLHEMRNLTYVINDQHVLTYLDNTFQACLKTLQNATVTSNGLIVESNSLTKTPNKIKRRKLKQTKVGGNTK